MLKYLTFFRPNPFFASLCAIIRGLLNIMAMLASFPTFTLSHIEEFGSSYEVYFIFYSLDLLNYFRLGPS